MSSSTGLVAKRLSASMLVLAVSVLAVMLFAATARAQEEPYSDAEPTVQPSVEGTSEETGEGDESDVLSSTSVLPFTGGDVMLFVIIAGAAIGTGLVLVRRARPSHEADTTD